MRSIRILTLAVGLGFGIAASLVSLKAMPGAGADERASFLVATSPSGAAVFVDGDFVGRTPLTLQPLAVGDHRLRLVKDGYLDNGRVLSVSTGQLDSLRVRLTPRASQQTAGGAGLKIVVIEGEGAVNVIRQKTAVAPVVDVRDRNDLPVSGALVTFAIQNGGASFHGARTFAVLTDAVGRASATGLTPTGSGALQIGASAAFQGQTAAVVIAQTNVVTAAGAAGAAAGTSGGAASGGTTGGAAAGGGAVAGGLTATTIGVVAGAAGAGTIVAAKAIGKDSNADITSTSPSNSNNAVHVSTTFSAPMQLTFTGCTRTRMYSGSLILNLTTASNGTVSGTLDLHGTTLVTQVTCSGGPQLGTTSTFGIFSNTPVTGTTGAIQFSAVQSNNFSDPGGGSGVNTDNYSFSGSLSGGVVTGTLTDARTITPGGSGTLSVPLTLK